MKSSLPKVMHPVGGMPMLGHVLKAASAGGATSDAVVVGSNAREVMAFVATAAPGATIHVQERQLGTAHAVLAAESAIAKGADDVLILYGDTPMVTAETLARLRAALARGADVVAAGFRPPNPAGYGRLVETGGKLVAIREERDASAAEKAIGFCNAGLIAFRGGGLLPLLKKIGNDNAKHEFYLTQSVALANAAGMAVVAVEVDADDVAGVNSRQQLAHVEGIFQRRAREAAMDGGATLIAPKTVWFSYDTVLGRDVTIEPNVIFGPGVTVADNVTIRANCHISGATIAEGVILGPFARIRPGTVIGRNAHIGNFVEVKNARIEEGAKANHLAYIGDAHIGAATNVGAGTITANYDGYDKHHTEIGANVSIGSNAVLVAPVTIGDGANIGAGSVITRDVPPDALALARSRQEEKPGWAKKYREHKALARNRKETKSR
jgi:bifunctional UDP-N-acetylglucosamine pyrophosphorylase/glucosamine-1-phosphate N-acetyltransferase